MAHRTKHITPLPVTPDIFGVTQALVAGSNVIAHPASATPRQVEVRNASTGAIISARVTAETLANFTLFVPVDVASARIRADF